MRPVRLTNHEKSNKHVATLLISALVRLMPRGITYIPVSKLLLDNKNPRLPDEASDFDQTQLLDLLERDFDLLPIGQSLADNGYFVEEPLIVVPKEDEEDRFIVVEGNRRLAALKLLTDPVLRARSALKENWKELAKATKYPLDQVPAIVHKSRDDLIAILGFRHISGILKWDPRSKARYIHDLVDKAGPKADIEKMARELGTRSTIIRDNYIAYQTYLQARDEFGIDTKNLEENFSVFYRALGNTSIQKFIGLTKKTETLAGLKSPIPEKKAGVLKEIIEFVHGTTDKSPVITDSRQLSKLGEILEFPEALKNLRYSRNLNDAYSLTGGEERSLIESLDLAGFYMDQALRYAHRHKESADVARSVERCARSLIEILKHFPEIEKKLSPSTQ